MARIIKTVLIVLVFFWGTSSAEAFKRYWFNDDGEKVYEVVTPEEVARIKSIPRRAYIRVPRENWEITPAMRARKQTTSQYTHRYY